MQSKRLFLPAVLVCAALGLFGSAVSSVSNAVQTRPKQWLVQPQGEKSVRFILDMGRPITQSPEETLVVSVGFDIDGDGNLDRTLSYSHGKYPPANGKPNARLQTPRGLKADTPHTFSDPQVEIKGSQLIFSTSEGLTPQAKVTTGTVWYLVQDPTMSPAEKFFNAIGAGEYEIFTGSEPPPQKGSVLNPLNETPLIWDIPIYAHARRADFARTDRGKLVINLILDNPMPSESADALIVEVYIPVVREGKTKLYSLVYNSGSAYDYPSQPPLGAGDVKLIDTETGKVVGPASFVTLGMRLMLSVEQRLVGDASPQSALIRYLPGSLMKMKVPPNDWITTQLYFDPQYAMAQKMMPPAPGEWSKN